MLVAAFAGCVVPPAAKKTVPSAPPAVVESLPRIEPGARVEKTIFVSTNEYAGFVFSVKSPKALPKPNLRIKNATGPAGVDSLHTWIARVHSVPVGQFPGWHIRSIPPSRRDFNPLDVVVPLDAPEGGMPSRLSPGEEYFFWVEMAAFKGSVPGEYVLPVVLESGGKDVGAINVRLTVWPMALPDETELAAIGNLEALRLFRHHLPGQHPDSGSAKSWTVDPADAKAAELVSATVRMLQEHKITPVVTDMGPGVAIGSRGEWSLDWSGYDRLVAPLLDGSAFPNRIRLPVWPLPIQSLADLTKGNSAADLVRQYIAHFKEKGWLNRSFALVSSSLEFTPDAIGEAQQIAKRLREADRSIRIAVAGIPYDMKPFGWYEFPAQSAEIQPAIWIADAAYFDPRAFAAEKNAGRQVWMAQGHPPFSGSLSIVAQPGDALALGWQASAAGADALWLGALNHWPDDPRATSAQCIQFDSNALLFPGAPFKLSVPVQTLRLKRLRESMQYLAYAKLLQQHGKSAVADSVRAELVRHIGTQAYRTHFMDGRTDGWDAGAQSYEIARRTMARAMLDATGGEETAHEIFRADELAWRRATSATGNLKTTVDGTRIRVSGSSASAEVQMDVWATLFNAGSVSTSVEVALAGIPPECEAAEEPKHVDVSGGRSAKALLSLSCEPAWCQKAQATELVVEVAQGEGITSRNLVRPSLVFAEPTAAAPRIDGDLSDWAPAAGNVATNFRLITGECGPDQPGCAEPARKTFAVLRRDARNLYIAINAEAGSKSAGSARRTALYYDDLVPMDDEDLVEILLDPVNGGTRSPNDLYHIVIKRSGVAQSERGITTQPPLGPRRPWVAELEIASRDGANRWTAELRIPLASFGKSGPVQGEIWGFNVTHYDAAGQEFSNWAGAVGNAYDPLSLGNMLLP